MSVSEVEESDAQARKQAEETQRIALEMQALTETGAVLF